MCMYIHKHSVHFSFSVTKRCETDLFILHKQQLSNSSIQCLLPVLIIYSYISYTPIASLNFLRQHKLCIYIYTVLLQNNVLFGVFWFFYNGCCAQRCCQMSKQISGGVRACQGDKKYQSVMRNSPGN